MKVNPIIVKSARARMRPKHLISWGLIVFTVTAFVSAIVYAVQIDEMNATPEQAARMTLLPVLIIQAVLLMLVGTGVVASGVAQEREDGLLDYQRLTPMTATSKLLGYLFGLQAREYALFALTIPFVLFGVIRGGFPLGTVLHFYVIFFSSVLVYHMTGIVAGMVSKRPRQAGYFAQGMVLILYFVLPNLSHIGFTFFEFLTIRPALFGLITAEIERAGGDAEFISRTGLTALDSFRDMPFYGMMLRPALYTLMVQGLLLTTLWTVAHRRLRDDSALLFSKAFSIAFIAGVAVFTLGSMWPLLTDDTQLRALLRHFEGGRAADAEEAHDDVMMGMTVVILCVGVAVMTLTGMLCAACATPDAHRQERGARRAARHGLRRVPVLSDGASAFPAGLVWAGLAAGVYGVGAALAWRGGRFMEEPSLVAVCMPGVFVVSLLVFLQAGYERFGARATFVSIFLLWMIPAFGAILLGVIIESETLSMYVASPFPPAAMASQGLYVFSSGLPAEQVGEMGSDLTEHLPSLAALPAVGYTLLAVPMAVSAWRRSRRVMAAAIADERA